MDHCNLQGEGQVTDGDNSRLCQYVKLDLQLWVKYGGYTHEDVAMLACT